MDVLRILEEKIASLGTVIQDLKVKNEALNKENTKLKASHNGLKEENNKLAQEAAQLTAKIDQLEGSLLKGNEHIQETKLVVDDLIKSIDALVASEHQQ